MDASRDPELVVVFKGAPGMEKLLERTLAEDGVEVTWVAQRTASRSLTGSNGEARFGSGGVIRVQPWELVEFVGLAVASGATYDAIKALVRRAVAEFTHRHRPATPVKPY
ncbi:MAG: hypothetical protein M3Q27_03130 [Actinomycetota bacterium]|nr:hypothetical protein [Actinomycetota bacterium]